MKNVPKSIWLHIGEDTPNDADLNEVNEITWCSEKQESNAIQYVNLDFIMSLLKDKYGEISLSDCVLKEVNNR